MGELRSLNPNDPFIYPSSTWRAAFRGLSRELQNLLGWLLFNAESGGGVVRGYDASEGAALRSDVTAGVALVYDSGAASPASKWAWVYSEATLTATHDAHHATLPRIDLLSLSWTGNTDTPIVTGQVGGTEESVDTQRGAQVTLVLTKGTANASPAAPATPAGNHVLWYVYVPATSGALVYLDKRTRAAGPRNRGEDPIRYHSEAADGVFSPVELAARKETTGETAWTDYPLRWSKTLGRPYCTSQRVGSRNFWMMLAEERKWWESTAILDGPLYRASGSGSDLAAAFDYATTSFQIVSASNSTAQVEVFIPLRAQARSLKIVGVKLDYTYGVAFDGSTKAITAVVFTDAATVASLDIVAAGTGARVNRAMTVTPTIVAAGDRLMLGVLVQRTGTGITNAGNLKLFAVSIQFEEGND